MVDTRTSDYLSFLSLRNRQKKLQNAKSPAELLAEKKEKGFTTTFMGANASTRSVSKAGGGKIASTGASSANITSKEGTSAEALSSPTLHASGWGQSNRRHVPRYVNENDDEVDDDPVIIVSGKGDDEREL